MPDQQRFYCTEHGDKCADSKCLFRYNEDDTPEHLRWRGSWPPPASWIACGTKVYRSYGDYCDGD